MEDGNRKRKKPSGCCNSRTARRVSENTDCHCVQFRVYLKTANAPDSGSFRTVPRHFSLKYESIPAEKCLAQHKNPSLLDTPSAFRCTLTEGPPKRKFFL